MIATALTTLAVISVCNAIALIVYLTKLHNLRNTIDTF
jgi:hypothetical protein